MAEKANSELEIPVSQSSGRDSIDGSNINISASPKFSRIFARNRSSSHHDSDEHQLENHSAHSESDKEKVKKDKGSWQFFGPPKAKSGAGWIPLPFSFAMTHREKNTEIHKIFGHLPSSEKLIDDYSSALQRDILIHGRLYLTQNWLCFYANIFSWETLLTIPLRTVVSITKERTALLIPNAILITTTVEKYGFSSLIQRDITYNVIFKVWQNSLLERPVSPIELVKTARKAWGDSTDVGTEDELWGPDDDPVSNNKSPSNLPATTMPTHLEIGQVPTTVDSLKRPVSQNSTTSVAKTQLRKDGAQYLVTRASDTMETATHTKAITSSETAAAGGNSPKSRHSVASGGDTTSTGTGSTEVHMNSPTVEQVNDNQFTASNGSKAETKDVSKGDDGIDKVSHFESAGSSGEFEAFSFPDDQGEVSCGCTEHIGRTILNEIYNADVETIFQLLFTSSDFFRSFLKSRKTTNLEIGDWTTQADSTRLRDVSYTLSLNYSFGPKYSPCTEHQVYFNNGQPGVRHIVKTDVINSSIPYGDTFYVSCLFCMTRVAHNKTRLRVTSNICFKKNCWGVVKNLIERNAGDGMRSYYNHLDTALKEYLVTLPAKRLQKSRKASRRKHRRQASLTKPPSIRDTEGTLTRRRCGSTTSHHSLKLTNQKASEEDVYSSSSGENKNKSNNSSLPKINVALTVLLGLLLLSNIALYHQLMGYQSQSSSFTSSSSTVQSYSQSKLLDPSLVKEWPTKEEDWINLVQKYWNEKEKEQQRLKDVLNDINNAMKQVEITLQKARKSIENHLYMNSTND